MPNPVPLTPPPVNARGVAAIVERYAGRARAATNGAVSKVTYDSVAPVKNTLRQRARYLCATFA